MDPNSIRITGPTLKVLGQLMAEPFAKLSGAEISRATGIASGTLYPVLFRLEKAGWLHSEWEDVDPSEVKRPRKRLYWMTAVGQTSGIAAFREVMPRNGDFAWQS